MRVLTINSGSSSIKFSVYELVATPPAERRILSGAVERIGSPGTTGVLRATRAPGVEVADERLALNDHRSGLDALTRWLAAHAAGSDLVPDAIGFRVVHGGPAYRAPTRIGPAVRDALRAAIALAPDHLPQELAAIDALARLYPARPQVACFDTAFHRHMPLVAQRYALPRSYWDDGVRRYGFHGLSYEYVAGALAAEHALGERTIIAHLGNGASLAAIARGVSIDTTMGFTPTSGLVMSTRSGELDPNVVLYLLRAQQLSPSAVGDLINRHAGLLALSGRSADMRDLLAQEDAHEDAAEAIAVFCYRARLAIGAMAAALGGLDTLVFTAGIGEHAPSIRSRICRGLEFLGLAVDRACNESGATLISTSESRVSIRVLPTNEELMIARHTHRVLEAGGTD